MKKTLFYTFLSVFIVTAIVTVLGIAGALEIKEEYLSKLFYALIVESIAPIITLFTKTDFFSDEKPSETSATRNRKSIVFLPKEVFKRSGDPHTCSITVYNQETDEENEFTVEPKRANGYLNAYIDYINEDQLIKVRVHNSKNEVWESQYFSPNIAKAEMELI
ncbi:MAG: hypothetical protein JAZ06_14400 [Candidatus Thiodiazotropha taylori]|nr:hypothetical protein [Candidatus Thiodiazotropha taylori]